MSLQRILRSLWPCAALLLVAVCSCGDATPSESAGEPYQGRPNVILIVVDTLRGDAIMEGPKKLAPTPNIDALAADGILFPHAFSHAPITLPSHTALFSSRAPFETGVMNNGQKVRENLPLVAEHFSDFGYATRAVISLGTLVLGKSSNVHRGFDEFDTEFYRMSRASEIVERVRPHLDALDGKQPFFLFSHFSDPHEPYNAHGSATSTAEVRLDGKLLETVPTSEMTIREFEVTLEPGQHVIELTSTENMVTRALSVASRGKPLVEDDSGSWLAGKRLQPTKLVRYGFETNKKQSDCKIRLWVSDRPDRANKKFRYYKEIEYADKWVGDLLQDLKTRGLYDDALIIFTSDHGESLNDRGAHFGHIQTLYDEQIHVPLIIKPPVGHPAFDDLAAQAGSIVPHVDLVPTVLRMCGLPELEGQQGKSVMSGGSGIVIAQTHKPQAKKDIICIRDERWKMIYVVDDEQFELYDIVADPGETNDVYHSATDKPDWSSELIKLAELAESGTAATEDGLLSDLEALGYGGSEEEPERAPEDE